MLVAYHICACDDDVYFTLCSTLLYILDTTQRQYWLNTGNIRACREIFITMKCLRQWFFDQRGAKEIWQSLSVFGCFSSNRRLYTRHIFTRHIVCWLYVISNRTSLRRLKSEVWQRLKSEKDWSPKKTKKSYKDRSPKKTKKSDKDKEVLKEGQREWSEKDKSLRRSEVFRRIEVLEGRKSEKDRSLKKTEVRKRPKSPIKSDKDRSLRRTEEGLAEFGLD